MNTDTRRPVRIANVSGFFGDRLSAAREMVEGSASSDDAIDVLTGDWLAELTMLILARQRMKHGAGSGYARTFLTQMEHVLGTCLDRGIRVVSNAGGLDPQGCADALREKAEGLGLRPRIAVVTGDDLMGDLDSLRAAGEQLRNLDTGETLDEVGAHLPAGADVVITGRVTDAALVVGPAAWWHDWSYDPADQGNLDALAGAIVAGHAIECGAQVTGGNYSFFTEVPGLEHPGFPIAEVARDGSSVITKHEGTGGLVSVGTVTAQLLYEIGAPAYANPDATALFDTINLDQVGANRVSISGVRGAAPPATLKVAGTYLGGFRNSLSLVITGLDPDAKADLVLRTIAGVGLAEAQRLSPGDLAAASILEVAELIVSWDRTGVLDAPDTASAQSHLRLTVRDTDPKKIGKPFTAAVVESALATYPGMFPTTPPAEPAPYGVYWPTKIQRQHVAMQVTVDGEALR